MTASSDRFGSAQAFKRMDAAIEALIEKLQDEGLLVDLDESQGRSTFDSTGKTNDELVAARVEYDTQELLVLTSRISGHPRQSQTRDASAARA